MQDAGIPHLVFSSVAAPAGSGVAHFESKLEIEKIIKASKLGWTILKPVVFMENFPKKSGGSTFAIFGMFDMALKGKSFQLVSIQDIGTLPRRT